MEKYIAVVKHESNKVTKYQDFAKKEDSDAHVAKYGGFVADKPSNDQMDYWVVDADKKTIPYDQSTADKDAAALAATKYHRDRVYPEIGDQLDMQYHDLVDGTTTWRDAIAKVKSDHPKP